MDISKLYPILNKESILKTANARELGQAPQDVLERYRNYALTHVPLGDTTRQLKNLERVIVENKLCAVGAIVGPYGYGKTSTAVHLWNELREQNILAIPPFLWVNLSELMDAVYHWLMFEFTQGPKAFIEPLEKLYEGYRHRYKDEIFRKIDTSVVQDLIEKGLLLLEIRPDDVVTFFSEASDICEKAGYNGLAIFTDELQATLAQYKPSRDEFFAHLFQIVKDIQGLEGNWTLIISMDDDTEGMITLRRADILARLQRSALYFRVKDVVNILLNCGQHLSSVLASTAKQSLVPTRWTQLDKWERVATWVLVPVWSPRHWHWQSKAMRKQDRPILLYSLWMIS